MAARLDASPVPRRANAAIVDVDYLSSLLNLSLDGHASLLEAAQSIVPPDLGFTLDSLWTRGSDPSSPRAPLDAEQQSRWRRWQRCSSCPDATVSGEKAYAPVWARHGAAGVLTALSLDGQWTDHQLAHITALAIAVAGADERSRECEAAMKRDRANARALRLAAIRAEVQTDLHRAADKLLEMVELSRGGAAPRRDITGIVRSGRAGLRKALVLLGETEPPPLESLEQALQAVIDQLSGLAPAPISVSMVVLGSPRPLAMETELLLIDALHLVMFRVQRNSRASGIRVALRYAQAEVELEVRDDGVNLATRQPNINELGPLAPLGVLRRRVCDAGGRLVVGRSQPRGVTVSVRLPGSAP